MTDDARLKLIRNWFSDDRAVDQAFGLLGDYDTIAASPQAEKEGGA